jgi:hypothetical protein
MDNYPVGYRRPPKNTRFAKGKSGNPKGRPKGLKNLKTYLDEELAEMITVREGAKLTKMTKGRALIKSLIARGLKGDARAAREIIVMDRSLDVSENQEGSAELNADDIEVMETFLKNYSKGQSATSRDGSLDGASKADDRAGKSDKPSKEG